jgi:hypothetical protein
VIPTTTYELVYSGTCRSPMARSFGGPVEPQFGPGTAWPLEIGTRLVMGRAKDCSILVDSMIAGRHQIAVTLEIVETRPVLVVENLGGGSSAFTDGKYFDDRIRLSPGGQFELGGVLVFQFRRRA